MNYKQKVLKLFCDNDDYDWAEKYATAELLNSETSSGNPFIFQLIHYTRVSEKMLKMFVGLGLNVKCVDKTTDTLLHACVGFINHEIIPFLLKCGLDINAKGYLEQTPLSQAIWNEDLLATEMLLEIGADVTRYLQKGKSIIEIAEMTDCEYVRMVRCRMAMDTLVCCLKRYAVSRDMIRLIRQFVWKTRILECWDKVDSPNKKIKN